MLKQYYGYGGGDPRGEAPPPMEGPKKSHALVMGLVPILLDAGCWYMVDSEFTDPTDDWKMVKTLALVSAGISTTGMITHLIGLQSKLLGLIFGVGNAGSHGYGLYQTYTADSDTSGNNATYMCYASNAIGTVLGVMRLLKGGPGGKPPKGKGGPPGPGGNKGPSGGGSGNYYYMYYL